MPPKARKAPKKKKKGYGKPNGRVGPPTQAQAQRKRSRKAGGKRVNMGGLDAPAVAYAKLLVDPCHAALVHPIYSGTDTGYLVKLVTYYSFPNVVGASQSTCGALQWTPGAISGSNVSFLKAEATATATNLNPAVTNSASGWDSNGNDPGNVYLKANASAYRTVAGCLEVEYLGAEQSRAGMLHWGTVDGSFIDFSDTSNTSVTSIISTLPNSMRMPDAKKFSINWLPTVADQQMRDPNPNMDAVGLQKDPRGALCLAWQGVSAATPFLVKLTAIYEWQPKRAQGLVQLDHTANSNNTLDQVLRAVGRVMVGASAIYAQNALMGQMARLQM